jgi:hypothetical protein
LSYPKAFNNLSLIHNGKLTALWVSCLRPDVPICPLHRNDRGRQLIKNMRNMRVINNH